MKTTFLILGVLTTILGFASGVLSLLKIVNPDLIPKAQIWKLLLFFLAATALGAFIIVETLRL